MTSMTPKSNSKANMLSHVSSIIVSIILIVAAGYLWAGKVPSKFTISCIIICGVFKLITSVIALADEWVEGG